MWPCSRSFSESLGYSTLQGLDGVVSVLNRWSFSARDESGWNSNSSIAKYGKTSRPPARTMAATVGPRDGEFAVDEDDDDDVVVVVNNFLPAEGELKNLVAAAAAAVVRPVATALEEKSSRVAIITDPLYVLKA